MNTLQAQKLSEFSSLEFILLGDLRDILESSDDRQTVKWLEAILDALLDTLPQEFELEETDGYMSEVLERYPNWSRAVDKLQSEHDLLFTTLQELRERLADQEPYSQIVTQLRNDLRNWIELITEHNRNENSMLICSLNYEFGDGD